MTQSILVLDPGSSSLKFGLFSFESAEDKAEGSRGISADPALVASGAIDRLGLPDTSLTLERCGTPQQTGRIDANSVASGMEIVLQWLQQSHASGSDSDSSPTNTPTPMAGIGCRIVHGGDRFGGPARVTPEIVEAIRELAPLAPLHNPAAADLLDACMRNLPSVPLFAVFDTTFHRTMPDIARTYALPFKLSEEHSLHRFGFHGIAHHYVSGLLLEKIGRVGRESRCITCHLGNGASVCAVRNGESIDTSMGMTPLEGLVMGTRSGDVDPGLLMYLLKTIGTSVDELEEILEHKSGLLGVSGLSGDMRDLDAAAEKGDARADLALELFAYRAAKTIGAYTAALEGLDAVAFSGGIGEHSASMRLRICRRLAFLGIQLDGDINAGVEPGNPACISAAGNIIQVWVIPADENLQIAREVLHELFC
jgi:acetate kinase